MGKLTETKRKKLILNYMEYTETFVKKAKECKITETYIGTGNPNSNGLPFWPMYDSNKNEVFDFQQDGTIGNLPDSRKARLEVIEKAFEGKNK